MYSKFIQYLKEVKVEMTKVAWPTREELLNSTVVVIVVSLIFSIFIFGADSVLNRVIGLVLNLK